MEIKRDFYLNQLISRMNNGLIKVITGIRRSGKSYLLFKLFRDYLIENGVEENHIICVAFDDFQNRKLKDAEVFYDFVKEQIADGKKYYILLDEVQLLNDFESVLNGFLHIPNADTFVTGSNAKFLSKDIITEFRGRGDEVHIYPLSFAEFMSVYNGNKLDGWEEYRTFGGLPIIQSIRDTNQKRKYLSDIFNETYLTDIKDRNNVRGDAELEELLNILASSIGSLTNPKKLSDTFASVKGVKVHPDTIKNYLDYLCDSFLIDKSMRYDIKGKCYINTPFKYYFTDIGLRNARLNFRQQEETHAMENIVHNELKRRGFSVDVGVVSLNTKKSDGSNTKIQVEVDFVCNLAPKRYYIQCSLSLPDIEKVIQEERPLLNINDSFKKIIIVKDNCKPYYTNEGILIINLFDFLLNPEVLNY